jgi:hypothetical protein
VLALHLLDEMSDDFCICLCDETVPLPGERGLQAQVVLDDAVMDDQAPGAVAVRVRVLFGRPAVRGPAGMTDALAAFDRVRLQRLFKMAQFAGSAAQEQFA